MMMTDDRWVDRHFYSTLFLAVAPCFMAGGWIVAFTQIGAGLIVLGSAMAVVGALLRPSAVPGADGGSRACGWLAAGTRRSPPVVTLLPYPTIPQL